MPQTPPRTATELVDQGLHLLLARDMAAFAELWAVDGVLEFPFAAAGSPQRLDGREAVREYLRDYNELVLPEAVTARTVHQTTDPDVVVAEIEVTGTATGTGQPYRMRYVAVITTRGGEIAHYRDYWSPSAAAETLGSAETLSSNESVGSDERPGPGA